MPSAKNTKSKDDPTTQTDHNASDAPAATAADQSVFDDEHPAREQIEETASPSDPSSDGGSESTVGEQQEETPAADLGDAVPVEPDTAPEGVTMQDPVIEPDEPDAPDEPRPDLPSTAERSFVGPDEVRLGQAIGLLHRLPIGDVLGAAKDFAEKIEVLQTGAAVQSLLSRMRASEGRCAPVYFTADADGNPQYLLAGDDALAAAKAIGLGEVYVILVQPGDAGAVHAYLNAQLGTHKVSTEDDDLVWRSNGYHSNS